MKKILKNNMSSAINDAGDAFWHCKLLKLCFLETKECCHMVAGGDKAIKHDNNQWQLVALKIALIIFWNVPFAFTFKMKSLRYKNVSLNWNRAIFTWEKIFRIKSKELMKDIARGKSAPFNLPRDTPPVR